MRKQFYLILFSIFTFFNVNASHIIGGEIYYDYLGNNKYRIFISVYRDCATVAGAPYDNPLNLAIYSSNNVLVQNVAINFPGSVVLPIIFSNPCVVTPTGFCNEKAVYTTVVTLPPTAGGYTLTYQRCCRRPDIININNPGDTGLTLTTHVPGTAAMVNSSPRFTNYPPLVLCNNDDLVFNHSATDPDGDQLTYELITPLAGATDANPAPNPAPPPNYGPVSWVNNFSAANPLGPGATISINSTTGVLTANPELTGMFVIGIRVKEYRNGVLIGQTDRDFIFKVINCNITLEAVITPQSQMTTFVSFCEGTTITFDNQSYGASSYKWDFGVPNVTTDVSTVFEPTFTFPSPGTYNVTLIANPGWPCTDTSVQVFEVNEKLIVAYTVGDSMCLSDNSFDFDGTFVGPAGTTFDWNFGPNASVQNATTIDVNNVSFSAPGFIPVTLTGTFGTCVKTDVDSVYIIPSSIANFSLPPGGECGGLTVQFQNSSTYAANNSWDFGIANSNTDVSTQVNPSFTFPAEGTYQVTLIANNNNVCSDTLTIPVSVYEAMQVSFVHDDSLCLTGNSFNFDATITGSASIQIAWDFGPHATPSSATTEDVSNVVYDTGGVYDVSLTTSYSTCVATVSSTVTVFNPPTINFSIDPGLKCAPYDAQFINLSTSDTPFTYLWDFGDGNTSGVPNPYHLYENPGEYSISLTVYTTEGCVDTLTLYKSDLVQVRPTPVSKFTVNPLITDICNPRITFADQSSGADFIFYNFDDIGQTTTDRNPVFDYLTPGQKRPMQIATNNWGCKDTSYQNLFIEPFTVYIPNTFTPDGNEFNGIFNAVIYLPISSWQFKVYDRWGEMLFVSSDPDMGWDGTYNGMLVQDDTYSYVLKYIGCDNNILEHTITGHVNVLK